MRFDMAAGLHRLAPCELHRANCTAQNHVAHKSHRMTMTMTDDELRHMAGYTI